MVLAGLEALTAMRRIPSHASSLGTALVGSFTLAAALGLACAGKNTARTNPCLDRCTKIESSLDRSSCEIDCQRLADGTANPPPDGSPPAAGPAHDPANGYYTPPPAESRPIVGQPTPRNYPATQPIVQPEAPRPTAPTGPAVVTPVTPAGPSAAELQQQRATCESGCDREPVASDRSTCRLQCAQITNRPSTSTGPTYVNPGTAPTSGPARPNTIDPQVLSACLNTCNDGPETDRATCRLQCNANGSSGPAPSSYYLHGGTPPSDADQRAAVIRSSQGTAGTTTPAPMPAPQNQQKVAACASAAQQCSTTCGAQLSPCTSDCDTGKMSATDRATCKLTCESTVDGCRDDCRIKEGTCRSKP